MLYYHFKYKIILVLLLRIAALCVILIRYSDNLVYNASHIYKPHCWCLDCRTLRIMAKNGTIKRRAKDAHADIEGSRRHVARMTAAPPLLNFNKQLMDTVIRGTKTFRLKPNQINVTGLLYTQRRRFNFTIKSLISGYSHLVDVFSEFKIVKVRVWAYTTLSTSAPGIATMVVTPSDYIPKSTSYEQLTVIPGAITRRIWQPLHSVYYPTSPSERNWFPSSETKVLFSLLFMARDIPPPDSTAYENELQVIWDVHLRCRGLKTATMKEVGSIQKLVSAYEVMTTN